MAANVSRFSWQAINTNLSIIAYFRGLRDNWQRATRQNATEAPK
jgi:hypothetical protein